MKDSVPVKALSQIWAFRLIPSHSIVRGSSASAPSQIWSLEFCLASSRFETASLLVTPMGLPLPINQHVFNLPIID
ncbi:unnamed protein product, partial [Citrullus colocynthis]